MKGGGLGLGGSWLGWGELQAMRVVCLSGGWLWKWKPPDDPGTHYPQAMQLLTYITVAQSCFHQSRTDGSFLCCRVEATLYKGAETK